MAGVVYVAFDGDNDKWAYGFMKGWKANKNVDFDFEDAHDLDEMTSRAQNETYVKSKLKERMKASTALVILVGEKTKNLYKFVRWEIELALELGLPVIVSNLNETNGRDAERCPAIIGDACAVHVPFKLSAIKHALEHWPSEYRRLDATERAKGYRYYDRKWD
ncbi:TIR domain-containing protein [Bradyrhizobium canariense]|uniref:Thoeris protein ThsB TIR-like domain-containing protein n=1 Tax=Bradyrhizobium canariense TaxID=255045 RepID=A0A1X3GN32_9BRAD|nr:TIR domain-containing protein [Bradyrhizobium canariense]OSI68571.1 hypothetical protein BSZ22_20600 [Bradyrhizobium canariense]OSI78019.1 hypothetical protein BSZ23_19600 [Bradyrhizobium canariense]OSI89249.1 hypothetical protein BSZ25_21070 [Bradyrhizobium canariense]OSI93731.1 hypothetical protein BSZ24_12300 [Bradyrhizobium canariense]OSJ03048.1 hypothetical protein BSZ16_16495 [Bradyrhizobium canariense]